ncbi:MAG: hypothetical protein IH840_05495 [Candidatus Heimdallarchaeota archaeon]|nr:hypothetical protein [Candidatus Heimdallarchaeota archaeon]
MSLVANWDAVKGLTFTDETFSTEWAGRETPTVDITSDLVAITTEVEDRMSDDATSETLAIPISFIFVVIITYVENNI